MLMTGDAAGMITPLCGNGMAMGIHAAKILSELVIKHMTGNKFSRLVLEQEYIQSWNTHFKRRLWFGRQVQNLFGNELASNVAVGLALMVRPVVNRIMRNTHGSPF
jgi:flavin-dependent dehydrogenase